jgi:predicted HTH transcriptional regulator
MYKFIDKILNEIEDCVHTNQYKRIGSENIELKNYGHKETVNWDSVMETVCSFLNSDNGIVIMGVNEDIKNQKYEVKGFNFDNENSLKEALKLFKDDVGHSKDIMSRIHLEQKELLGQKLMIIYVDSLSNDEKYVFYKEIAYERIMGGDEKISNINLEKQKEYKAE